MTQLIEIMRIGVPSSRNRLIIVGYFCLLMAQMVFAFFGKIPVVVLAVLIMIGGLMVRGMWGRPDTHEVPLMTRWQLASVIAGTLVAGAVPLIFMLWINAS
jgi:hypothetical protein